MITGTKQYIEINKINKKQKKKMNLTYMICYTQIKVLNVNTLHLTLISSSAFNVVIYEVVGKTPFKWNNSNVSNLFLMYMPCEWSNESLIVMQTDWEKLFSYLAVFKRLVTNHATHHTYQWYTQNKIRVFGITDFSPSKNIDLDCMQYKNIYD